MALGIFAEQRADAELQVARVAGTRGRGDSGVCVRVLESLVLGVHRVQLRLDCLARLPLARCCLLGAPAQVQTLC